jgi:hypothetical protein
MITSLSVLTVPGATSPTNATNLSLTQTSTAATIASSTGTGVTISAATSGAEGLAGLLDNARATIIDSLAAVASSGDYSSLSGLPSLGWFANFIIDGGGSVISTGVKGFLQVGLPVTLSNWALIADQSGSIGIDIWKTPSPGIPTVANSIVAGAGPALASQQYGTGSTFSWGTSAIAFNDVLAFNVNSASTVTRVTIFLLGEHT